jgi:dipeptidyl aminopeptidase/acylaminoacyl peptidase
MPEENEYATLDDALIAAHRPGDPQVSPDGEWVAWTATPYGMTGEHPESAIWLAPADGSLMGNQFTSGNSNDLHPRWSPDSRSLAFLSDRAEPGTAGLYLIQLGGGEAIEWVTRKADIQTFAWSPDGQSIAFTSPDEPSEDEERRKEERKDANVYGEKWPYARLYLYDVDSGESTKLEIGDVHVCEIAWAPDSSQIALLVTPTPEIETRRLSEIKTVDVSSGGCHDLGRVPGWMARDLLWTNGGQRLCYVSSHEAGLSSLTAYAVNLDDGAPQVIGAQAEDSFCVDRLRSVPASQRHGLVIADGLKTRLEWVDPRTGDREYLYEANEGDISYEVSVARTPGDEVRIATLWSRGDVPPEIYTGAPGDLTCVSNHHSIIAGFTMSQQEAFYWSSPDGLELDGVLIRPHGRGDGPYPTVVHIHGGPYGRYTEGWAGGWTQSLANEGYAVLMPNYRGGEARGNEFAKWGAGLVGDMEFADVMSAVDAAIERGIADPERLGIGGWSQGGFLTAWGVTQTDRFKAGVMGAGVSDWGSMVMSSDVPTMESMLAGGRPWDGPGPHSFMQRSPISYAKRVRTPLLILHGEEDARVPVSQAIGFHRALMENDIETVLVTYPREPHGIREAEHMRDAFRRVREWFDRHLKA